MSGGPVADFVRKGGNAAETAGRKCLCNGLVANLGLGQRRRDGSVELPLVMAGDHLDTLGRFVSPGNPDYSAADVLAYLLADIQVPKPASRRAGRTNAGG